MRRYINTARRMWLLLAAVLLLAWAPGLYAAYGEYTTTFESDAIVWVQRTNSQYSVGSPDDPSLSSRQSPGGEQAEIFGQLLQTNSFLSEVIGQTSLARAFAAAADKEKFIGEVRKRFRAQTLGTNLIRVAYRANEPRVAAEMVSGALIAREGRVKNARIAATSTSIAFYQKEFEIAQTQAFAAQSALDEFNKTHTVRTGPSLSSTDEYQQNQLRLAVDVAQSRLGDLRTRLERGTVSTALLDMAESLQFEVIDQPRADPFPSGGTRGATLLAGVAIAGGLALVIGIVLAATLMDDLIRDEADLADVAESGVFGTVTRAAKGGGDLREELGAALFGAAAPAVPARRSA